MTSVIQSEDQNEKKLRVLVALSRFNYGDQKRGESTEYCAFIPAIERLGHTVQHFETYDSKLYSTYTELNHAFLKAAQEFRPDLVLTQQRDCEIWSETLDAIRTGTGARLVTWTTDDSFKFDRVSKFIAPFYDVITTTYDYRLADYAKAGLDHALLTQWAANSAWTRAPKPAKECKYQVTFVGSVYGERAQRVEELRARGIQVDCFGYGWPNGPIPAEMIPEVINDSVVSLNFSAGFLVADGRATQIKARTFEVPGAGGFLMTDGSPGLDQYYVLGQEIEVFQSQDDLATKIEFYLEHPAERDRVANAGYKRTLECHTYEGRFQAIIEYAEQRKAPRSGKTGTASVKPVVLPSPKVGVGLRLYRWLAVSICTKVWGKRGPNAARRLTFGLSRRLMGTKTFSAAGIPGRIFPYV